MHWFLDDLVVELAGRSITRAWDRVSRYCGLEWSGGAPETWAFAYYDTIESSHDDRVTPVDVTAAATLHPGLSRADLAFFADNVERLSSWLREIPADTPLHLLDDATVDHISTLSVLESSPGVTLLSKVLHRKRPDAVPLVDRHVIDLYRPITGHRAAANAYPAILQALRSDIGTSAEQPLSLMRREIERRTGHRLSLLRVADITVWMRAHS